jgi:hypothetical protein
VTTELRKLYDDIVHGRNPRYSHWTMPVMLGHPASA